VGATVGKEVTVGWAAVADVAATFDEEATVDWAAAAGVAATSDEEATPDEGMTAGALTGAKAVSGPCAAMPGVTPSFFSLAFCPLVALPLCWAP
jgi:hypothetical protein